MKTYVILRNYLKSKNDGIESTDIESFYEQFHSAHTTLEDAKKGIVNIKEQFISLQREFDPQENEIMSFDIDTSESICVSTTKDDYTWMHRFDVFEKECDTYPDIFPDISQFHDVIRIVH
jgi:hypothetical protein